MIDRIEIDCDEAGFHLILHGDLLGEQSLEFGVKTPIGWASADVQMLDVRLSQDAAWQLVDAVRPIVEWRAEGESVRADFDRYRRTGEKPDYVRDLDHAIELDEGERLRAAGDLERKRRRENP